MTTPRGEITRLLAEVRDGNSAAQSKLATLVYHELHEIASRHMRRERPNHTLQATALVNDAYMKLLALDKDWQNRAHFFAVASSLMRRILVDHARKVHADKRGGRTARVNLDDPSVSLSLLNRDHAGQLLELDEALSRLMILDKRQFRIVEMRFFGGMTDEEIASVLEISKKTVMRDWVLAKAWLHMELSK